jgi:signal peptidase
MTLIIIVGLSFVIAYFCGIQPFVVESGSMEPEIHVGSVCFVNTKVKYEDIKVNDIIAFKTKTGMRVTHRVIDILPEGFETKGDANASKDGPKITQEDYMGKTIFSIPKIGFAVKELQKPTGMIIGGILVIIFVLIGLLFDDSKKEKSKHKKEKDKKKKVTEEPKKQEIKEEVKEVSETSENKSETENK